ncbi:MAG: TonB-dependent receptor [Flavobacteriales bacterium]|nr:TonB-dependent receptor [Flavobacteriales bacterium]
MIRRFLFILVFILATAHSVCAQVVIRGVITDGKTSDPLAGAAVYTLDRSAGSITDERGRFEMTVPKLPVDLLINYIGYTEKRISVRTTDLQKISLNEDSEALEEVVVKQIRVTEKQQESPLTMESIGVKAIQEAPAATFYESLGNLKGVDITSASLGFRVVNTRGFNSTSPVRSLQLIDGVDNQSPGLNFSLGNFLGASDLDVKKVDIVAGASSAFYGPNAFNGVIIMETKDPFKYKGLSAQAKMGERALGELSFRFADVLKNKEGADKFAYKINAFVLKANDWEATNYDPTSNSSQGIDNPGRYDAINIYGDEVTTANNNTDNAFGKYNNPGLGEFYRSGYREIDLTNYKTENFKINTSLHFKPGKRSELIYAFNMGGGNTVYQGDNRYALRDIRFWQNRLEFREEGKFFFRIYSTQENAGNSYDIVSTAIALNDSTFSNVSWNDSYKGVWNLFYKSTIESWEGYPTYRFDKSIEDWEREDYDPFMNQPIWQDSLRKIHAQLLQIINESEGGGKAAAFEVGTQRFDSMVKVITSQRFNQGGTLFYDKSALYHAHGEYIFEPESFVKKDLRIVTGANGRLYRPNSGGTIFKDTGDVVITNYEFGLYAGIEKYYQNRRLKLNLTSRMDKNQNFNFLFSPALSAVYKYSREHIFRLSFSSAIRNPTLSDQYLYYNVGRALLIGNLDGYDSLITLDNFSEYRNTLNRDTLEYFNVAPIRPEQVKTIEIGYKGFLLDNSMFVDAGYYFSLYDHFIGYNLGLDVQFQPGIGIPSSIAAYRLAANARNRVTTQGFSAAISYFKKKMAYTANYSWNVLNKKGTDDPIIPAFNTPAHKFNIGLNGRELTVPFTDWHNLGFGVNYKWIQGFTFEGSPQFTGFVPSYDMVDAQLNYHLEKWNSVIKIGVSNLFGIYPLFNSDVPGDQKWNRMWDNRNFQVYGGPYVGRLAYMSWTFDVEQLKKKVNQ